MTVDKTFSNRLESLLFDGEKKSHFAQRIGTHANLLGRYFSGQVPSHAVLVRIAAATGVSVHWLLTGEGEKFTAEAQRTQREEGENQANIPAPASSPPAPLLYNDLVVERIGRIEEDIAQVRALYKTNRAPGLGDVAELVAAHLDLAGLAREEGDMLKELVRGVLTDARARAQLGQVYRFYRFPLYQTGGEKK